MSKEIESLAGLRAHPKIVSWDTEERWPGAYRLHLKFTNGREASIITGPGLLPWLADPTSILEIAALTKDGDLDHSTDVIGPDVWRGTPAEAGKKIMALADLPPEDETPLEGKVHDHTPGPILQNMINVAERFRNYSAPAIIPGEIISTTADGPRVLCAHCAGNGRLQGGPCWHCDATGEIGPPCPHNDVERELAYGDPADVCKTCGDWWYV